MREKVENLLYFLRMFDVWNLWTDFELLWQIDSLYRNSEGVDGALDGSSVCLRFHRLHDSSEDPPLPVKSFLHVNGVLIV